MSLLAGDEYHDGVEKGVGKYSFSDGAIYEGEMFDGRITGKVSTMQSNTIQEYYKTNIYFTLLGNFKGYG